MTIKEYELVLDYLKDTTYNTKFENHLFAVGGCVRDYAMGSKTINDIDLVVDLPNGGIEFAKWLNDNGLLVHEPILYPTYGTSMFTLKGYPSIELEAVETRKETYKDKNSRNPNVEYGTLSEDCLRRDLTINALYYDISNGKVIDLVGGLDDIKNKVIKTPTDPNIIFNDDPLRMLRVIRFANKYDWEIQNDVIDSIKQNAERISIISKERITEEVLKSLHSAKYAYILPKMWIDFGLFDKMFYCPEDTVSVREFLIKTMTKLQFKIGATDELYFWALFRDNMNALYKMKLPNKFIDKVLKMNGSVNLFSYSDCTEYGVRKFGHKCGNDYGECWDAIRTYCECEFLPNGSYSYELLDKFEAIMNRLEEEGTMFNGNTKLPINGDDIMKLLNLKPSRVIKGCLTYCWNEYYKNPHLTKNDLENKLISLYNRNRIKNDK